MIIYSAYPLAKCIYGRFEVININLESINSPLDKKLLTHKIKCNLLRISKVIFFILQIVELDKVPSKDLKWKPAISWLSIKDH